MDFVDYLEGWHAYVPRTVESDPEYMAYQSLMQQKLGGCSEETLDQALALFRFFLEDEAAFTEEEITSLLAQARAGHALNGLAHPINLDVDNLREKHQLAEFFERYGCDVWEGDDVLIVALPESLRDTLEGDGGYTTNLNWSGHARGFTFTFSSEMVLETFVCWGPSYQAYTEWWDKDYAYVDHLEPPLDILGGDESLFESISEMLDSVPKLLMDFRDVVSGLFPHD